MLLISSFSFCFFLPACFNFQGLRKLQIQTSQRQGMCVRCSCTVQPLQDEFSHSLLVLCGHIQAPAEAVGLTEPMSTSCSQKQAQQSCAQVAFLQSCLVGRSMTWAHSHCYKLRLPRLGKYRKGKGEGVTSLNSCKGCDSFICSSMNTLAR